MCRREGSLACQSRTTVADGQISGCKWVHPPYIAALQGLRYWDILASLWVHMLVSFPAAGHVRIVGSQTCASFGWLLHLGALGVKFHRTLGRPVGVKQSKSGKEAVTSSFDEAPFWLVEIRRKIGDGVRQQHLCYVRHLSNFLGLFGLLTVKRAQINNIYCYFIIYTQEGLHISIIPFSATTRSTWYDSVRYMDPIVWCLV